MNWICSLALLFFIMASFCLGVRAESPYWAIEHGWFNFGDNEIEWTYDSPMNVLTFSGNGSVDANYDNNRFDSNALRNSINAFAAEKIVYEEGITYIGSTDYVGDSYFSNHRKRYQT